MNQAKRTITMLDRLVVICTLVISTIHLLILLHLNLHLSIVHFRPTNVPYLIIISQLPHLFIYYPSIHSNASYTYNLHKEFTCGYPLSSYYTYIFFLIVYKSTTFTKPTIVVTHDLRLHTYSSSLSTNL